MTKRLLTLLGAIALSLASTASAQNLRGLTRTTAVTGTNDSALVLVSDSAFRTRAASTHELFKRPRGSVTRPAFSSALDSTSGMYMFGADTIGFALGGVAAFAFGLPSSIPALIFGPSTASPQSVIQNRGATVPIAMLTMFGGDSLALHSNSGNVALTVKSGSAVTLQGGAGNMTVKAGTGNSRTMTLQTTTSAGTAKNVVVLGADSTTTLLGQALGYAGTAALPTFAEAADPNTGIYTFGADTLGFSTGGTHSMRLTGGGSPKLTGAAGSMTIQGGTGAGSLLILQSEVGSTFASGALDTLKAPGPVIFSGLTTEPSTQSDVCIDATSEQIYVNAAATCTVSARRFKRNIAPLTLPDALRIGTQLRPVTFTYRSGGRRAIGLIAEDVDAVDTRLTTRNAQGLLNSVNYEEVAVIALRMVQQLQKRLDAVCASGVKAAC